MNYLTASLRAIRQVFRDGFYLKIAVLGAAILGFLDYWLFYRVSSLPDFLRMAYDGEFGRFGVPYAWISLATTALTILLFGVALTLLVWLYRHSRLSRAGAGLGAGTGLSSALGAGCPICGAFLLQLTGLTAGLAAFPLKGLEFRFLGLGLVTASIVVAARKMELTLHGQCAVCDPKAVQPGLIPSPLRIKRAVTTVLIAVLAINHILIGQAAASMGMIKTASNKNLISSLFGVRAASAKTIISTKLNPDGRTTTLGEWPTVSDVPANPKSGDPVADAKMVMIPTGTPFYAPEGISFDDAEASLAAWQKYEDEIQLTGELEARWQKIIGTMTCDYCCGGPMNVTVINRCGCRHAKAWRSISKYLLQKYGDKYSDDEILGELKLWKSAWYPKGVIEDYLLATGNGNLIGHETHGGAGQDNKHGF